MLQFKQLPKIVNPATNCISKRVAEIFSGSL